MARDEYHEAILERIHALQEEIRGMSQRQAHDFAFVMSREMPEEAVRMLVADLLLDYWKRMHRGAG